MGAHGRGRSRAARPGTALGASGRRPAFRGHRPVENGAFIGRECLGWARRQRVVRRAPLGEDWAVAGRPAPAPLLSFADIGGGAIASVPRLAHVGTLRMRSGLPGSTTTARPWPGSRGGHPAPSEIPAEPGRARPARNQTCIPLQASPPWSPLLEPEATHSTENGYGRLLVAGRFGRRIPEPKTVEAAPIT
jgi:hypothetical protein